MWDCPQSLSAEEAPAWALEGPVLEGPVMSLVHKTSNMVLIQGPRAGLVLGNAFSECP